MTEQTYHTWGVVDVMGHQRYAGEIREVRVAGGGFIQVDVPSVEAIDYHGRPTGVTLAGFTKVVSPAAVHSMTPTTEEVARAIAQRTRAVPVSGLATPLLAAPADDENEDEFDDQTDHEERD